MLSVESGWVWIDQNSGLVGSVISSFSASLLAPLVSDGSSNSNSSSILETLDGLSDYGA